MLIFSTKINFKNVLNLNLSDLNRASVQKRQKKKDQKYSNIDTHSDKFIRLARLSKLANISPSLKSFCALNGASGEQAGSSSPQKDLTQNVENKNYGLDNKINFPSHRLSLLLLNQGLRSKDLIKLRSYLKFLGLNLTHIPTRFWTNAVALIYSKNTLGSNLSVSQKNPKQLRKSLYGNILWLHNFIPQGQDLDNVRFSSKSNQETKRTLDDNRAMFSLYKLIQNSLIQNNNTYEQNNLSSVQIYNEFSSLFQDINTQDNFFKFSKLILPWGNLATGKKIIKSLPQAQDVSRLVFESWIEKSESVLTDITTNSLLVYLKNNHLIYAGMLNITDSSHSYLYFDNIDSLRFKFSSDSVTNPSTYCQDSSLMVLEPYFLSVLNRKYLMFL